MKNLIAGREDYSVTPDLGFCPPTPVQTVWNMILKISL